MHARLERTERGGDRRLVGGADPDAPGDRDQTASEFGALVPAVGVRAAPERPDPGGEAGGRYRRLARDECLDRVEIGQLDGVGPCGPKSRMAPQEPPVEEHLDGDVTEKQGFEPAIVRHAVGDPPERGDPLANERVKRRLLVEPGVLGVVDPHAADDLGARAPIGRIRQLESLPAQPTRRREHREPVRQRGAREAVRPVEPAMAVGQEVQRDLSGARRLTRGAPILRRGERARHDLHGAVRLADRVGPRAR